jgi:hypothetical protein
LQEIDENSDEEGGCCGGGDHEHEHDHDHESGSEVKGDGEELSDGIERIALQSDSTNVSNMSLVNKSWNAVASTQIWAVSPSPLLSLSARSSSFSVYLVSRPR